MGDDDLATIQEIQLGDDVSADDAMHQWVILRDDSPNTTERIISIPANFCTECNKCYSDLQKHIARKHTALAKTFKCELCSKTFQYWASLKTHTSFVHSENRPFSCQLCDKTFKQSSTLNRHLREVHVERKTYGCFACEKKFTQERNLRTHIAQLHALMQMPEASPQPVKRVKRTVKADPSTASENHPGSMRPKQEEIIQETFQVENDEILSEEILAEDKIDVDVLDSLAAFRAMASQMLQMRVEPTIISMRSDQQPSIIFQRLDDDDEIGTVALKAEDSDIHIQYH